VRSSPKFCLDKGFVQPAEEEDEEDGDYDLTDKFIAADEDEEGEGGDGQVRLMYRVSCCHDAPLVRTVDWPRPCATAEQHCTDRQGQGSDICGGVLPR